MTRSIAIPSWLGLASLALAPLLGVVARSYVHAPYVLAAGLDVPIAASNHDEVYAVRDGHLVAVNAFGDIVDRSAPVPPDALGLAADLEAHVAWTTPSGLTVWDTVRGDAVFQPFDATAGPIALCDAFVVLSSTGREVLHWQRGVAARVPLPAPVDRLLPMKDACDELVAVRGNELGRLSLPDGAFESWFTTDTRGGWCRRDGCVLLEGTRIVRRDRSGAEVDAEDARDVRVLDLLDPDLIALDGRGQLWVTAL